MAILNVIGVDMSITNNEGETILQTAMKEAAINGGKGHTQEIIDMLNNVRSHFGAALLTLEGKHLKRDSQSFRRTRAL